MSNRKSFKKFKDPDLYVIATDQANVREVEPDGSVLQNPVRFVGKRHLPDTYQESNTRFCDKNKKTGAGVICVMDWEVITEGVLVPYAPHTVNEVKLGHLLPGNAQTALLCGVDFPVGSK